MAEDPTRLVAWAREMRTVHDRLRRALRLAREALADGTVVGPDLTDPLLHCWGLCAALTGHHAGEDDRLFPAVVRDRPDLADAVDRLRHDHHLIELLLTELRGVAGRSDPPEVIGRHLDGLGAIMDSHFGYEERTLLRVLDEVDLGGARPSEVFGPLADP